MHNSIIPIVALLLPIIVVLAAFIMKYAMKKREYEHAERMLALDLGIPVPGDEAALSAGKFASRLTFIVPIVAMAFAMINLGQRNNDQIWAMSGLISVVSIVSGTFIASKYVFGPKQAAYSYEKPRTDHETADFYANHV